MKRVQGSIAVSGHGVDRLALRPPPACNSMIGTGFVGRRNKTIFETLTDKLGSVFSKITSRGVLSEKDIDDAMREIRIALLEADVSLPVVKEFIAKVKEQSVGEKVVRSIQPGQMVVKIVHDELVKLLGGEGSELNLNAVPPACILMVGLQGSGKTTTSAKIANRLKNKKKVMLVSLDIYRPAAQEQLAQLAEQTGVYALPVIKGEKAERAALTLLFWTPPVVCTLTKS